jgi:hypothetical protein
MTKPKATEPELQEDAWARFERAIDVVAKSPPQHRTKAKPSGKRKKSPKEKKKSTRS